LTGILVILYLKYWSLLLLFLYAPLSLAQKEQPTPAEVYNSELSALTAQIKQEPINLADLLYDRAQLYTTAEQLDLAYADYSAVIRLIPDSARAYFNRAHLQTLRKKYTQAIRDYTISIKLSPQAQAYNNRGLNYLKISKLKKAEADFVKAIELEPEYSDAFFNLGTLYERQQQLLKSKKSYEQALEQNPSSQNLEQVYYRYALVLANLNYLAKALEAIEKALELGPKNESNYILRAHLYKKMENFEQANLDEQKAEQLKLENLYE